MRRLSLPDPRPAVVAMVGVLGTWYAAWRIERAAGLGLDVVVLATVLALTLARVAGRARRDSARHAAAGLVALPAVALLAVEVGRLVADHEWLGGAVFVLVLAAAVWLRRFGPAWARFGTLVSLPFLTLLVVPVQAGPAARTAWPALLAVIAFVCVDLVHAVARALGLLPRPASPSAPEPAAPRAPGPARLAVSTRMALQLLVGLAAAYALGRWLFPSHWPWVVLSCYVVCSGNRGRGDVLHKGVLRLAGALVGTVAATLAASPFAAGDRAAIVLLFLVMGVASWLRPASYAFWAAGTTAMLALLHGYLGVAGGGELGQRLLGLLVGAVLGVAASWFVLPVRSSAVFRRRWADALATLSEVLTALRETPAATAGARARLAHAVARLQELEPAFRFHRRTVHQLLRPRAEAHPADLVATMAAVQDALERVAGLPPETLAARRDLLVAWARCVGGVRRRMRGEQAGASVAPTPVAMTDEETDPALAAAAAAFAGLEQTFTVAVWRALGGGGSGRVSHESVTEVNNEVGVVQPIPPSSAS